MPTTATPADFFIIPDSSATWTPVGAITTKFNSITFSGYKSAGVPNTGNIRFRPNNGSGYITIEPENDYTVTAPTGTFYRLDQFELYSETSGDGLYAIYSSAVIYEGP